MQGRGNPMRSVTAWLAAAVVGVALVTVEPARAYDPRPAAVSALAALDGMARHCRYNDRVVAIRDALRTTASAHRGLARAFETLSDRATLQAARLGHACPGADAFGIQFEAVIARLRQAFGRR